MKPAPFDYYAPTTLEEALALTAAHGTDGKLLAGGQSLIPVMNFRLAQPTVLIDLNGISALQRFTATESELKIGAMVRQSVLERDPAIAHLAPLIHATMPYVAHSQIRNRGTLGGSLAHADPAAELPVLAVARDARFRLQRQGGDRWVAAADFYQGLFETALADDEILTEIDVRPLPDNVGYSFHEFARRHGDYAQAGVAVLLTVDDSGVCQAARLVYLNVGDMPMDAKGAAAMLVGNVITPELIEAAAQFAAANEIAPSGDVHGSAAYKRHLAAVLGKRAIVEALSKV